jgi:hypothetical protein
MIKSYEKWFKVTYLTVYTGKPLDDSEEELYLGSFSGVNGNMENVPFGIFLAKLTVTSLTLVIK